MPVTGLQTARWLALLVPAGLVGGALIGQYQFGLAPCEMCHWQRWPHYAAIVVALVGLAVAPSALQRVLTTLAALLIAASGAIGLFHAGVEYGWWQGLTQCASVGNGSLEDILNTPLTRCDVAPWDLFGISLAGFNGILSLSAAGVILALLARARVVGE